MPVPPHVPDAARNDVPGDAVGGRPANAGSGNADGNHQDAHPAAGNRPIVAAPAPAHHQGAHQGCQTQVQDDHQDGNGTGHEAREYNCDRV